MLDTIRRNFERFGFLPIETPVFELSEVLLTKSGGETERHRRRELLKRLAFLGAAGVGGKQAQDLGQGSQTGCGRSGFAKQRQEKSPWTSWTWCTR